MNRKHALAKIGFSILGLLMALTFLELAVRAYARLANRDRTLEYDSTLGWKLRPGAQRFFRDEAASYLIGINSKGFRDKEHSYEKPAHTFRVLVLGDSFVFGSGGVPVSERFTELLERRDPRLEVINMGVPGYSTDQEYLQLRTEGLKYHPDLVLLCMFVNDFAESFVSFNSSIGRPKGYLTSEAGKLAFHPPPVSRFYAWADRSYLLASAERVFAMISPRRQGKSLVLPLPKATKTFRLLLETADELCRANGAEFILVYFPFEGQQSSGVFGEVMQELRETRGVPALDLTALMRQKDAQKHAYFDRDVHFNAYGHQIVAEALYGLLLQNTALRHSNGISAAGGRVR